MKDKLNELIQKGQTFNFRNNCENTGGTLFSMASDELLAWIANVEDFIKEYYGEDSSPFKLYNSFDRNQLSGYYQSEFDRQLITIMGALKACEKIEPKPKKKEYDDNLIIRLIRNPYYWTSLVILIGASFTIGLKIGGSKFDQEKSNYFEENKELIKKNIHLEKTILAKDSIINVRDLELSKLINDKDTLNNN